ncbi:Na+/H+ antiporter subunit E [Nocardioides alcanivorans]|uniref:Na+/H+ antiporter subunit E n=1 Tax=Nocardioides alcanivorans TaxID=2897352 RepID=UPI001F42EE2C|nr:Na+/H+ antiporter subunit E [Nocardioides alcanivorans]
MSPRVKVTRSGKVRPARYKSLQWPALVWLTLVWMALWRTWTLGHLALGFVVSVLVCLAFPLPPLRVTMRPNPIACVWLVVRFMWDVIVSSVEVAKVVLRPKGLTNAIVEVDLVAPSDFVLTIVAEMTTLIPGSVALEARRSTHTLFFHVINVKTDEDVEKFRRTVLAQEQRVLRAFGSPRDPSSPEKVIL